MKRPDLPAGLLPLLILAAGFYALFIARTSFPIDGRLHFTLIDDAMISMRYAQHLAVGHGLVWNVGEPPVQGFTNPGWVLVMAGLHVLPFAPATISLGVMAASGAMLLLNAVVLARICLVLAPRARHAPLIVAALAAFYFPLVFWSLRGMEVGLLVLLIDAAVLQAILLRPGVGSGILVLGLLLAAALIVRIDAAFAVTLILLYVATSQRLNRRRLILLLSLTAGVFLAILASQQVYFGSALPNTYYQKLAGGPILERLRSGTLAFYNYAARDVLLLALISAAGIWMHRHMRTKETALLAGIFVAQCTYSVWIGGDYAEPEVAAANRFITQGMPALFVLFSLMLDRTIASQLAAHGRLASVLAAAATAATLLVVSGMPWLRWADNGPPLWRADVRRARAGLAIAENTSPDATIAVHAAGQIPYYSERRTLDLLGLNDPVIAHSPRSTVFYPGHDKWNYDYSIGELQPDLIADNWVRLADYMKGRPDYRKLENGMYIRVNTTLVNEAGLLKAYP